MAVVGREIHARVRNFEETRQESAEFLRASSRRVSSRKAIFSRTRVFRQIHNGVSPFSRQVAGMVLHGVEIFATCLVMATAEDSREPDERFTSCTNHCERCYRGQWSWLYHLW